MFEKEYAKGELINVPANLCFRRVVPLGSPTMEKEHLKRLKIMNVKKGDMLVLTLKSKISEEEKRRLLIQIKELFPENKCIVLEEGLRLKIVRNKNKKNA